MLISWEAGTPPPPCQNVNTSEGAKIRVGGKIYVIEQGRKRWITSEQILNQCYGGGSGIQDVTEACANSIPDGLDITSCGTPPPPPPEQPTPQPPPRCIIATAAYGSEMAPEVTYMRYVRDNMIGSTETGRTLVNAFNVFYYSWSPGIAQAIVQSPTLQALFRILLTPLVLIIHVTASTYLIVGNGAFASVIAFAVAAALSTFAYVILPALAVIKIRRLCED
jgi:hypothetical protein